MLKKRLTNDGDKPWTLLDCWCFFSCQKMGESIEPAMMFKGELGHPVWIKLHHVSLSVGMKRWKTWLKPHPSQPVTYWRVQFNCMRGDLLKQPFECERAWFSNLYLYLVGMLGLLNEFSSLTKPWWHHLPSRLKGFQQFLQRSPQVTG